jgi:hypothetical protein
LQFDETNHIYVFDAVRSRRSAKRVHLKSMNSDNTKNLLFLPPPLLSRRRKEDAHVLTAHTPILITHRHTPLSLPPPRIPKPEPKFGQPKMLMARSRAESELRLTIGPRT